MDTIGVLAVLGRRLNREAGHPPIPSLYFFTDPERTPDPVAIAERLPRDAAVVFRHFGKPNRKALARRLRAVCDRRGLALLVGNDPLLAREIGADGVHWPERALPPNRAGFALETAAAHSGRALTRAASAGMDAAVLGAVFNSRSPSAARALGLQRASRLARDAQLPIIALGGVNASTGARLIGRGFAGLAAVDAFVED